MNVVAKLATSGSAQIAKFENVKKKYAPKSDHTIVFLLKCFIAKAKANILLEFLQKSRKKLFTAVMAYFRVQFLFQNQKKN